MHSHYPYLKQWHRWNIRSLLKISQVTQKIFLCYEAHECSNSLSQGQTSNPELPLHTCISSQNSKLSSSTLWFCSKIQGGFHSNSPQSPLRTSLIFSWSALDSKRWWGFGDLNLLLCQNLEELNRDLPCFGNSRLCCASRLRCQDLTRWLWWSPWWLLGNWKICPIQVHDRCNLGCKLDPFIKHHWSFAGRMVIFHLLIFLRLCLNDESRWHYLAK